MGETRNVLRSSWRTVVVLLLIIGIAAFLRVYFVAGQSLPGGYWSYKGDYSGGSDPFYWERALNYSFLTGKEISWDYAMNYPIGTQDVRPPLFDWFNLLTGYLISPVFPSAWIAAVFMLIINSALFGALTVIPTYLLGKEAFNKRVGLVAALLLAISAAALQRSHATIAIHDAWTLFFVVCAFYFYTRALKTLNRRRWVENWFQGTAIRKGLREFFRENRKSTLYALLAGMCVAVTALSWQGFAYVPVLLVLIFLVELMLDRIRNQDTLGVTILFLLILATPLLVSFPWYYVRGLIRVWWDVPFYLFAAALVLGLVFTVTRDYPWTIVIPTTFIASGIAIGVLSILNPSLLFAFYSGAGYFVKNKVYQTIAEAQEPGMSELILSFGWFTFFIGLAAVALMIWQTPRRNNPAYTMLVFWLFGALFMALSAARFIFNAAPVFAVATAFGVDLILLRMDFAGMRRTYRSLAEGSRRNALRKSVKARHVLTILFLAFLVLLPNVWFAVDAGIPYDEKAAYDRQINALLPSFLQAPDYNQVGSTSSFYLGAFGYSLPKSTDYFPAAWNWLNQQDTSLPLDLRPSFMSWWDYGFEAAQRGGHPVVADPFQNGYAIAGQFILTQNESSAIALMTIRLLEGDYWAHGRHLGPAVTAALQSSGLPTDSIEFAFRSPASLIPIVLASPGIYGPWDSNMQAQNAQYIYLSHLLLSYLGQERLVSLHHAIESATGKSIAYFMVDTRLFPISAQNTGIFYAPAKLSDRRVISLPTGQIMPQDFFQIFADTATQTHIPAQTLGPADQIQSETIEYQSMFYNSMFYRAFVGYSPTDIGVTSTGIPGFDQALQQYSPIPAWNLTHWRVVYRTAYYNPYTDPANHTAAWQAMNYEDATALQKKIQTGDATGVVDLSTQTSIQNGLVILRYYDGAWVNGTVTMGGVPLPGVWIRVSDELGTPHYLTKTDAEGHYSALAPFGNVTISVTSGNLTALTLLGDTAITQTTFPVTLNQALRKNEDVDGDGTVDWTITKDFDVSPVTVSGTVFFDTSGNSAYDVGQDTALAGAVLTISAYRFPFTVHATTDFSGTYRAGPLAPGTYNVTLAYRGHVLRATSFTAFSGVSSTQNLIVPFGGVGGIIFDPDQVPASGATVTLTDALNGSSWSMETNASGAYTFSPILQGSYNLTAASGVLGTLPQPIDVGSSTPVTNLTLEPLGRVAGTTLLGGIPTGHLLLRFQSETSGLLIVSATSDAAGGYSVSLPAGSWDVNGRAYVGPNLHAYLGRVKVQAGMTTSLTASFLPGVRLDGSVTGASLPSGTTIVVAFMGLSGTVWARLNASGAYAVFLPQGAYDVQATAGGFALYTTVNVGLSRTLDLELLPATSVSGTVYWDRNGNGVPDTGEGIAGARIDLTDELHRRLLEVTSATGAFTLVGFDNRTYSGTVSADGFASRILTSVRVSDIGPTVQYTLQPVPVQVSGRVLLNETVLLNRVVTIRAVAASPSARAANTTSSPDGSYSLSLVPGGYRLEVDENVSATNASRYQNLGSDAISLAVGESSLAYDLSIAFRALVAGNVTLHGQAGPANMSFSGPETKNVTITGRAYRVYLQPGTYQVAASRTISGVAYGVFANATIPLAGNLSLALGPTARLAGRILYGTSAVAVTAPLALDRLEGGHYTISTSADGSFLADLVPGNYTVRLNASGAETSGGVTRYYRYVFQGTLEVPPSTTPLSYDLSASRSLDNTTVSGTVTQNGAGVDATLSFIAQSGGALNATVSVPSSGVYAVGLAPGTYVVYALRSLGETAFLGSLSLPHALSKTLDVSLVTGHRLSGVTTDAMGTRARTTVTIRGAVSLNVATDVAGAYEATLPSGTYNVSATLSGTDRGLTVQYSASTEVSLLTDAVANLQLRKVVSHGVLLSWDAGQNRTIAPGSAITYAVTIRNTGNVDDTFTLAGETTGWGFTFAPSSFSLNYGVTGNSAQFSVTIQTPTNALVDHAPVAIVANSVDSPSTSNTLELAVGIARLRSLSVAVDMGSGTYDGRYLNYTVGVKNGGNAPETVTVTVTNPADLAASGWVARVGSGGSPPAGISLADLSVGANSSASVRLSLLQTGGASGATVVLSVTAQDNAAVAATTTSTLVLPSLAATTGVGVTGPNTAKTLPLNLYLVAILVGVASAVAAGLFLTRRRR